MKKINFILFIVSIIGVIFAFSLFFKEGDYIKVNSKNEEIVIDALKDKIENTDDITMVILGNGFHSGELTIHHSFGSKETLYVWEGSSELEELEEYIRENGEDLDDIGFGLLEISVFIFIYLFAYKIANKENVRR